jgi:hypothetical protein
MNILNNNPTKISNIRNSVSNSTRNFSNNAYYASKDFIQTNGLIAKFVFLILVLIIFLVVLNLGIMFLGYVLQPPNSPYLVKGMINGTFGVTVPQDPKMGNAVMVQRSNNQSTGMEFTWCVWLNINNIDSKRYQHIFSKGGNLTHDDNGIMNVENAPGVYIKPAGTSSTNAVGKPANLFIMMNTVSSSPDPKDYTSTYETIDITEVPLNSWFNLMIRLENKVMDIYINGTITQRKIFSDVPLQNFDPVYVCQNGGFAGNLSDLRYFNYALNVFQINNIVSAGPNTTLKTSYNNSKDYYYLSNMWYNTNSGMFNNIVK